ncbi:3-methyladenine DNA glycosylase [Phytohabitans kaempferiae]|uniref:3-methyladenine DNA glycosylase n=1 Tax=Phytohabitans kaempferiae TaxID=1620943 RepID=A0ABV6M645_9ACTN
MPGSDPPTSVAPRRAQRTTSAAPGQTQPPRPRTLVLEATEWRARRATHEARVDAWLAPHLARRQAGEKHPVEDFLFTYYSFRPAQLRRWHPGAGVTLEDGLPDKEYIQTGQGVMLDPTVAARKSTEWIGTLLRRTAGRPAHFGCFGMHEWAMVYRAEGVRHEQVPLRLSPAETDRVVDDNRVRCSHFDAFRFFTPAARPLNLLQPTRETQHDNEQPGCLHANMDLYKWAYKLSPLVASELVADAFALARDIRALDMRASPYDLADLGYEPVRVETPEGRAEYAAAQRAFAGRAAALRARLIAALDRLDGSS